jgi:uncharacterized protein GlcG (DUF336 family)
MRPHLRARLSLTSAEANRVIAAAMTCARAFDARVSVAVCNSDGRLIAFRRMEGAAPTVARVCISRTLGAAAAGLGLPEQGALPIVRNGVVWGACGVSGTESNQQDEDCARAGIAALGSSDDGGTARSSTAGKPQSAPRRDPPRRGPR